MALSAAVIADADGDALPVAAPDALLAAAPQDAGLNPARLREATALLSRYVADRKIAGAVAAVARNGRLAYLEAVGVQDLQTSAPMTERSLFRIYSMTKAVTAVAVMMLHEEGRFGLADPIAKYLPEFKDVFVLNPDGRRRPPAAPITVRDLLLHTSGISHRTSRLYRDAKVRSRADTLPQFIARVVQAPLMEDPGTTYRYSESTTVLGRLVEIWSGQPFDAFLNDRVLIPLKMADTTFWVRPEQGSRLTTVYSVAREGSGLTPFEIEELPFTERPRLIEGAVGLVSTVPDYVRFCQMMLNRGELDGARLLQPSTIAMMTANGLSDAVRKRRGGPMGWGLANVNVVMDPGGLDYPANRGEYGWDGSAGTIFWIDPTKQTIIVLMTQSVPANPDSLRQRFKTIVHEALVD
jgi:CubicO group peptidase (beta-lactamase class C family)